MKKALLFTAVVASAVLVSCSKENNLIDNGNEEAYPIKGFTVSMEDSQTKASLNSALTPVWATGDALGVAVHNSIDSWSTISPCYLTSGAGYTVAEFEAPGYYENNVRKTYSLDNTWNHVAFFPYYGGEASDYYTYLNPDKITFKLPNHYDDYTTGKFLSPMIGDMTGSEEHPESITFKHVGGAVKITVNKVPAKAHTVAMTASGKQVVGTFAAIAATDAGTAKLVGGGKRY